MIEFDMTGRSSITCAIFLPHLRRLPVKDFEAVFMILISRAIGLDEASSARAHVMGDLFTTQRPAADGETKSEMGGLMRAAFTLNIIKT